MGKSRVAKKVDRLEQEADKLRKKAEKKGKELSSVAAAKVDELTPKDEKSGKKGIIAVLVAAIAGGAFALKKKRDQELDEALWEEPRSI